MRREIDVKAGTMGRGRLRMSRVYGKNGWRLRSVRDKVDFGCLRDYNETNDYTEA